MLFNWSGLLSRIQTRESSQKGRELIMPMWQHLMFFLNPLQQCSCKSAFCWLSSANALILQTSNWMSFLAVLTSSHSPLLHQYSPLLLGLQGQIFIYVQLTVLQFKDIVIWGLPDHLPHWPSARSVGWSLHHCFLCNSCISCYKRTLHWFGFTLSFQKIKFN